jgi:CTP-dependent riboflavin kinase
MNAGAVTLEGRLCRGLGEGAVFTALDWVEHQFRAKLGFRAYPGTLNLHLAGSAWDTARAAMRAAPGIAIDPPPGFCAAKCFAVLIAERIAGAAILPDMPDYPGDKLEIVAPVAVRQELRLNEGDRVKLQVHIA